MWWSILRIWFTLYLSVFVYNAITSALGVSLGIRSLYVKTLLRLLKHLNRYLGETEASDEADPEEVYTPLVASLPRNRSFRTFKREFKLSDALEYTALGVEAINNDIVTKRFTTPELTTWNFLTRTRTVVTMEMKRRVYVVWILSVVVRYALVIFFRLPISIGCFVWLIVTMCLFGLLPQFRGRRRAERFCTVVCSRMIATSFSAVIRHYNKQNKPKCGGICVANHTSPLDVAMLATENCFTLVGQRQGGFFGILEMLCSMAQTHIWFERSVAADRSRVTNRLKEHVQNEDNNPILIFPEGTCINNTGVFMFKKGCFELGATIYPAVIKYNRIYSDPYWNSAEQNLLTYIFMLMTSWAIVCDITYLEPQRLQENETAIEFAYRVKRMICEQGGLVDLDWDGRIKREVANVVERQMEEHRRTFAENLQITTSESEEPSASGHNAKRDRPNSDCLGDISSGEEEMADDSGLEMRGIKQEDVTEGRGE